MKDLIMKIARMGPAGLAKKVLHRVLRIYHGFRTRNIPIYQNPTDRELAEIEDRLLHLKIHCHDFAVDPNEFWDFVQQVSFPPDYHGGSSGGVYYEKLLEHYISWKMLRLDDALRGPYVDVAAGSSPWAKLLRAREVESFAIDVSVSEKYSTLNYYWQEDATKTSFKDAEIGRASLQCAYEMFLGSHDIDLLGELGRILKPGGKVVISPLYTHTHPCYYQTPEYHGKIYGDAGAKAYVRRDCWGIPASRKYSPETLKIRVWDNAINMGLQPSLYALRNKKEISEEIYLHFILVLEKASADIGIDI